MGLVNSHKSHPLYYNYHQLSVYFTTVYNIDLLAIICRVSSTVYKNEDSLIPHVEPNALLLAITKILRNHM